MMDKHAGLPQSTSSGWIKEGHRANEEKSLESPTGNLFRVIEVKGDDGKPGKLPGFLLFLQNQPSVLPANHSFFFHLAKHSRNSDAGGSDRICDLLVGEGG